MWSPALLFKTLVHVKFIYKYYTLILCVIKRCSGTVFASYVMFIVAVYNASFLHG